MDPQPMYCEEVDENGDLQNRQSANVKATRKEKPAIIDTSYASQQAPVEEKPTIKSTNSSRRKQVSTAQRAQVQSVQRKQSTMKPSKLSKPPLTLRHSSLQNVDNSQRGGGDSSKGLEHPPSSPAQQTQLVPSYAPSQFLHGYGPQYPQNSLGGPYFPHMSSGPLQQMSSFSAGVLHTPGYPPRFSENHHASYGQNYLPPVNPPYNPPYNPLQHFQHDSSQIRSMQERFKSKDITMAAPARIRSLSRASNLPRSYVVEDPRYEFEDRGNHQIRIYNPHYQDDLSRQLENTCLQNDMAPPPRRNPSTRSANSEHRRSSLTTVEQSRLHKKAVKYADGYPADVQTNVERGPSPPLSYYGHSSHSSSNDVKMREQLHHANTHQDNTGADLRGGISHSEVRTPLQHQLDTHSHRTRSSRSTHSHTTSDHIPRSSRTCSSMAAGYSLIIQTTGGTGPTEIIQNDTRVVVPQGATATLTTCSNYDDSELGSNYSGPRRIEPRVARSMSSKPSSH